MGKLRDYFHVEYKPGERKLLQKIDFFILTFCCLSYFTNYLDRTNLNNAYVTGMREDLSFSGSQLNQIITCFNVGYILGQLPSNLALSIVRPRIWFPSLMLAWAALTMVTAAARTPQQVMAIRFFMGIFEASTFVGTHYVLGAWYTEKELGKRSGVFTASGLVGSMVGGFVQSGIWARLDGRHGLAGWRWLFIVDGLVTLPVAAYGYFLFPDTPETTTAPYLTQQEKQLAVERMKAHTPAKNLGQSSASDENTQNNNTTHNTHHRIPPFATLKHRAKSLLRSSHWWGFILLWILAGETESFSTNTLLALYMKTPPPPPTGRSYTIPQINNYPTGVPAAGVLSTLFWATLTDALGGHRDLAGYFVGTTGIATATMLLFAKRQAQEGLDAAVLVFAAYYWAGAVYACQATFFAWCNDAMRGEEGWKRGVVLAGMNMGSNAVNAWWTIVFYGAEMTPWFERGMYAMIAVSAALVMWCGVLSWWLKRNKKNQNQATESKELRSLEGNDAREHGQQGHPTTGAANNVQHKEVERADTGSTPNMDMSKDTVR